MPKIKSLAGFLGLILLSQSDLISLHKHAKRRFHMNVIVYFLGGIVGQNFKTKQILPKQILF